MQDDSGPSGSLPESGVEARTQDAAKQELYCRYGVCFPGDRHAHWCTEFTAAERARAQGSLMLDAPAQKRHATPASRIP
jgi:hypothetical protein